MIDAGDSEAIPESPRESLFKDLYFVSDIGSGIAKRFKDPALNYEKDQIYHSTVGIIWV